MKTFILAAVILLIFAAQPDALCDPWRGGGR